MKSPLPVLLVEDIRLFRDGLRAVLDARGIHVVATARSARDALTHVTRDRPCVVLLDAGVANHENPALVRALRAAAPDTPVVVTEVLEDDDRILEYLRAGADGFILRDATARDYVAAIRAVARGQHLLPPAVAAPVFRHFADAPRDGTAAPRAAGRLTRREREIVLLIAEGCGNKEIAGRLHIAVHTVKTHIHSILEKLGLRTRLQISAAARRDPGLRELDPAVQA